MFRADLPADSSVDTAPAMVLEAHLPRFRRHLFNGIVLALLLLFFCYLTVRWVQLNRGPTQWDDAWYLQDSLHMYDDLVDRGVAAWFHQFFYVVQLRYKAPLMCALPTPVYLLFGRSYHHALYLNLLFIPMLLLGIYGIARRYWSSRAALLAVFICGSMPDLYGLTTWYLVEYGLAALTVLAIFCLVRSQDLSRTRWVLLFSVVCGFGLLQKILFPVYVAPVVLYLLYRWAHTGKAPLRTFAALFLPMLAIAGPWYYINYDSAIHRAMFSAYSHEEADLHGTGDPWTARAIIKYLTNVINEGFGAPYLCVAIVVVGMLAIIYFRRRRTSARGQTGVEPSGNEIWWILLYWVVPFVIFLCGRNKATRFIAPLVPAFALVLAFAMDRLMAALGRAGFLVLGLLLFPLFCQIQVMFEPLGDWSLAIPRDPYSWRASRGLRFVGSNVGSARTYMKQAWPLGEVLDELADLDMTHAGHFNVMIGPDTQHFNLNNLQLEAFEAKRSVGVSSTSYYSEGEEAAMRRDVRNVTFFLYRVGNEPENRGYNKLFAIADKEVKDEHRFSSMLSPVQFPDGESLYIYRNNQFSGQKPTSAFVPATLRPVDVCEVHFGHGIELIGLYVERADHTILVRYRWGCTGVIDQQYRCFTHVVDATGKTIMWMDHDIAGGKPPMVNWQVGDTAWEIASGPPAAAPQGNLRVDIGLYNASTGQDLKASIANPAKGPAMALMPNEIGISVNVGPERSPGPAR